MQYLVTMTSATDRVAAESRTATRKAAEDLAKLYRKSGFYTTIYVLDDDGKTVEAGRTFKPLNKFRKAS